MLEEAATKGGGRPQTATASRRQWMRWTQQWRVDNSGGGEGGTGGTMRCEAVVKAAVDAAAVRAVEGDDDGDGQS
ncbi:hypothetical protein Syun_030905 [Stephania yunnanensis]|uniref:Uncharacterized protein n=1 Tax=Stephania yunnanensis TaxID=152371 RepID=A0AAP0HEK3_9MAGN